MSKCTCGKAAASICCEICKQKAFCSSECQSIGWSAHSDAGCNVHRVDDIDATIYSVDAGLEFMTPQEIERLEGNEEFLQSDITTYLDPKGIVHEQHIDKSMFFRNLKSFGAGKKIRKDGYTLDIEIDGELRKTIADLEVLYKGASGKAGQLADLSSVRWSGASVLWAKELRIPIEGGSTITSILKLNGKPVSRVTGTVKLSGNPRTAKRLEPEYKIKFGPNLRNPITAYTGYAPRSMSAFRFIVDKNNIIDAEFAFFDGKAQRMNEPMEFKCDANDIDHVTGLVAALEDKIASGDLMGETIQQHLHVINAHREALEREGEVQAGPKVQAAIHGATTALWEHVGAKAKQKNYLAQLNQYSSPTLAANRAFQEVSALAVKIDKARRSKIGRLRKNILLRQLDDWELAISQYIRKTLGSRTMFENTIQKIQNAREPLVRGMEGAGIDAE